MTDHHPDDCFICRKHHGDIAVPGGVVYEDHLVYAGNAAPHLHVWVVDRYPGTPRAYWGLRVDEWPQAPRGGPEEIMALCGRVRAHLRKMRDRV